MRQFLFVSAFTVSLAVITPAMSQPWPSGIGSGPPPATAYPPTAAPTTPNYGGNTAPGYQWRDQRANSDWRNNTWREQRFNKIGVIITGEHGAQRKIGSSAGLLKNK